MAISLVPCITNVQVFATRHIYSLFQNLFDIALYDKFCQLPAKDKFLSLRTPVSARMKTEIWQKLREIPII